MSRKWMSFVLALGLMLTLASACGNGTSKGTAGGSSSSDKKVIKLGVRDNREQVDVVIEDIKKAGYEVEVTVFDDSIQPNVALAEKSIDINWYQHEPYLKNYNAEKGTNFIMVQPKTAAPLFAMYSKKIKNVNEIKNGETIGICSDAANKIRGLRLLESQGLIKLDPKVESPTQFDIKENPKNLKFIEADMQVLPQSLPDVSCIVLAAAHMVNAGLNANDYVCASNDADVYAVGFVVREEDKDAPWASGLAKAVQSEALAKYYKEEKQGVMVPLWK